LPSLTVAYGLWLGSWETALVALATASRSGILSVKEAARHKETIAVERRLVTEHFARLIGRDKSDSLRFCGEESRRR
jgi:hypothetical protein